MKNVAALIIVAGTFFFYHLNQPHVNYELEPLMDGNQYSNIYHFFKGQQANYQVNFPFHSRIGVPWLASLLPNMNIISSFLVINAIFTLLGVWGILHLWDLLKIDTGSQVLGFCWLVFHWIGIIRLNIMDPITVDVPLYFLEALFIIALVKKHPFGLIMIPIIGLLIKESFLALPIILMTSSMIAIHLKGPKTLKRDFNMLVKTTYFQYGVISLLLSILLKELINWQFAATPISGARSNSFQTIYFIIIATLLNPERLIHWLGSLITALGPIGLSSFVYFNRQTTSESPVKQFLFIGTIASLGLGLLAGGGMTRIIFLGFPFIITLGLLHINTLSLAQKIGLFVLSTPFMRLFNIMPLIHENKKAFFSWYPEFMPLSSLLYWLAYGMLIIAILVAFQKRNMKHSVLSKFF